MGTRRTERAEQFRRHAGPYGLSPEIMWAAVEALERSLDERRGEVMRNSTTHASSNTLGAVILYTTALDVALTEVMTWQHMFDENARARALDTMTRKFKAIAGDGIESRAFWDELACLSDLRDEIVHYLPRSIDGEGNVPSWFLRLHERGFFVITGRSSDFQFSQKLGSYALGYWAARTVDEAARHLKHLLPTNLFVDCFANNASLYRSICPPEQLGAYDAAHGLSLTVPNPA